MLDDQVYWQGYFSVFSSEYQHSLYEDNGATKTLTLSNQTVYNLASKADICELLRKLQLGWWLDLFVCSETKTYLTDFSSMLEFLVRTKNISRSALPNFFEHEFYINTYSMYLLVELVKNVKAANLNQDAEVINLVDATMRVVTQRIADAKPSRGSRWLEAGAVANQYRPMVVWSAEGYFLVAVLLFIVTFVAHIYRVMSRGDSILEWRGYERIWATYTTAIYIAGRYGVIPNAVSAVIRNIIYYSRWQLQNDRVSLLLQRRPEDAKRIMGRLFPRESCLLIESCMPGFVAFSNQSFGGTYLELPRP